MSRQLVYTEHAQGASLFLASTIWWWWLQMACTGSTTP
jgi:hypothetical protein